VSFFSGSNQGLVTASFSCCPIHCKYPCDTWKTIRNCCYCIFHAEYFHFIFCC